MSDSQEGAASGAAVTEATATAVAEATAATDAGTNADSSDENPANPATDLAALAARITEVQSQAMAKADFESIKRTAGHVPGIQSRLDALEAKLGDYTPRDQFDATTARIDALIDSMGDLLDPGAAAKLKSTPRDSVAERLAAIEDAVRNPKAPAVADPTSDSMTPEQIVIFEGWNEVDNIVRAKAKEMGVDILSIPEADFTSVFNAYRDNPADGLLAMMTRLDVAAAAQRRRAERAEAAEGGDDASSTQAPRKGALTRAMMMKMTTEELLKWPRAERDAALAAK